MESRRKRWRRREGGRRKRSDLFYTIIIGGGKDDMGFPAVYSEDVMPKFLLQIVFLLGHIRKLITSIFDAIGLADIILDASSPSTSSDIQSASVSSPNVQRRPAHRRVHAAGKAKPLYATLIQDALPVVKYEDTKSDVDSCAVCLHKLDTGDEVRQLRNCRHVFHKLCLDPWVELDQRTCPLCRSPLVPDEIKDEIDEKLRSNGGGANSSSSIAGWYYNYDDEYYNVGEDYFDEAFGFILPTRSERFTWASLSSTNSDAAAAPPLFTSI